MMIMMMVIIIAMNDPLVSFGLNRLAEKTFPAAEHSIHLEL